MISERFCKVQSVYYYSDHHNTTNNANASSSSAAMGNQVTCSSGCSPAEDDRGVIKLVLDTPVGDKVLYYRRRNTEAGKRWFSEVRRTTKANLPIKDDWRIYNAPGGPTTGKLISDLMKVIDVINSYSPGTIPKDAAVLSETMPRGEFQEALNRAHTHFETMMRSADRPAEFWRRAPAPVRTAIEHYNLLIHALEDDSRARAARAEGRPADVRAVVTFEGRRRVPLRPAELAGFAPPREFGVAYLNYCMVGKHLLEACWDEDRVTGVLRPQTHLSADTLLWFGPSPDAARRAALEARLAAWWAREGVEARFPRADPASAVGYLPVADLLRGRGDATGWCRGAEAALAQLLGGARIKSFTALR